MSSRREEIAELLEILNKVFGDENSEPEKKGEPHESPTETKGFKSLVSDVEYKAVCDLANEVQKFIDPHNQEVMKIAQLQAKGKDDYAMFQYMKYTEQVKKLMESVNLMKDIHSIDKDFVDSIARDCTDGSVKRLLHISLKRGLLDN